MKEVKPIIWLALASLGFRIFLYFIFHNEIVVGPDFINMANLGRRFASGEYYGVLDTYWSPAYPILIGIITFFTKSALMSATIISILAASLIAPFTYYLIEQSYGQKAGIIAAIIAIFFPHLSNSMFSLGTENIYLLLITGALILGWRGFSNDSTKDYFGVGILVGLAYLTRPEAFGYLVFFILVIFSKSLWEKKLPFGRIPSKQIFTLLIGFALLATPYIIYLKQQTGTWTISGKIQVNTITAYAEDEIKPDTPDDVKPGAEGIRTYFKYFVINLMEFQKSLSFLLPSLLFILIGLGLFVAPWNKERLQREIYLVAFCLITILGYAVAVVRDRYFYILLPIFFGWIAYGVVQLERWFQESKQNFLPNRFLEFFNKKSFVIVSLIIIFAYVFPINFFVRTKEKAWEVAAYEERDAGLWLKENGNPSALVFSAVLRPVFYSEHKHLPLTTKTIEDTLKQIKEKKVEYVITSERSLYRNPTLKGFTEVLENSPDFEMIYDRKDYSKYRISIFRAK